MKIKKLLLKWQIIFLILALLFSFVALQLNPFTEGATIRNVIKESPADIAGVPAVDPSSTPMSREFITSLAGKKILSATDFYEIEQALTPGTEVLLETNEDIYRIAVPENTTLQDLGLRVYDRPTSNLRKGLDLEGGTRVLLQPEEKLADADMDILIANMMQRLNVFGLSDIVVKPAGDLSGNQFVLIEIAGANEEEVKDLIAKQGVFEAKIGNETVFTGGADIKYVCRSPTCSGIDSQVGCGPADDETTYFCGFRFAITLSQEAAQRQADITSDLDIVPSSTGTSYLEHPLDLYLDGLQVDSLQIASSLKGTPVTEISISGSGTGIDHNSAVINALDEMKRLQTVLITGSLPVKLNVVKTDNISPVLGQEFLRSAFIMVIVAILAVAVVLIIAYKRMILAIPITLAMVSEIIILLGIAAASNGWWTIDLVAIAGIIVAVGTGVDDQIVITDETLRGKHRNVGASWKQKLKNAFFIIMAAYVSLFVAMLPLVSAGTGILRGFAIATIVGTTIGVVITRPAYAAIIEFLVEEDD